ncbi:MAG: DUF4418 family protein [Methanomassiliicoccales archaeon]|nr:DUF4418 family protein [Methanomassiliicoccales archaeon]
MKLSKRTAVPAFAFMAIGILVAVAPWTFAPVCEVHTADHPNGLFVITNANKTLPMPCGYTARAEIGVGAGIVAIGGMILFTTTSAVLASLAVVGLALGGMTVALPTVLTKMCAMSSHTCNTLTAPTLGVLTVGLMLVSVGMIVYRGRFKLK